MPATADLENNDINDNNARDGGGVFATGADQLFLTDNDLVGNVATRYGGAVRITVAETVQMVDNRLEDNEAANTAGALFIDSIAMAALTNNQFLANTSTGSSAGGMYCSSSGTVALNGNTFQGNRCLYEGGAVYAYSTTITSTGDTYSGNQSDRHGGGLYLTSCDLEMLDGTIEDNIALSHIGGIHLTGGSTGTIQGSTISDNHCAGPGGGIDYYDSSGEIVDCLIEGNSGSEGGGISLRSYSNVQITGNRILGNVAETGNGGGIRVENSLAYIDRNLIGDNDCKEGYGGGVDCYSSSPMLRWNVLLNNYAPKDGTQIASQFGSPWLVNNVLYVDDPRVPEDLALFNVVSETMPLVVNSIIWGAGPSLTDPNSVHLYYSNTSDGPLFPEDGNISEVPVFIDATNALGPDGEFGTDDDGFRLQGGSPCIDTGHAAFLDGDGSRSDISAYGDALPAADLSEVYVDWLNVAGPWDGTSANPYQHIWEALLAASRYGDSLTADFDADGDVDGQDLLAWQRGFGTQAPNATRASGDADDDLDVDGDDLNVWRQQFGSGSITVHVGSGYYEENPVVRSDTANLTVSGAGAGTTIVNGTRRREASGVTEAWFATNLEVSGLTLQNGRAGGGGAMRIVESRVSVLQNTLQDCWTNWDGGGIQLQSNSTATIDGNQILRNDGNMGGGIRVDNGCEATITNNVIAENWTSHGTWGDGGGLWLDGLVTVSGNVISDNSANDLGGGIYCNNGAVVQIDHNVIYDNTATYGGGLYAITNSDVSIINNTFSRNQATYGGGIRAWKSNVTIINTILWENEADFAPELDVQSGADVTISYCDIKGGRTGVEVAEDATLDWGVGIIYANPRFAPHVDDFHLMSTTGRWEPSAGGGTGAWVVDAVCSPGIDRGQPDPDPADPDDSLEWDWTSEPNPNGQRINMGAYGGTVEASMTCDCQCNLPVIVDMDPEPASAEESCSGWIQVWFNVDMLPSTVENPENWQLVGSGGDGLFFDEGEGTDNDLNWSVLEIIYTGDGGPAELLVSDLPCGCLPG